MSTDQMLNEIVNYDYEAYGFPHVFLDYNRDRGTWQILWRNPVKFNNERMTEADTPKESCEKALQFIKGAEGIFTRRMFYGEVRISKHEIENNRADLDLEGVINLFLSQVTQKHQLPEAGWYAYKIIDAVYTVKWAEFPKRVHGKLLDSLAIDGWVLNNEVVK